MPDRKSKKVLPKGEKCTDCPEAFRHFSSLRKHSLLSHKTKLPEKLKKPGYCKLCLISFSYSSNFKAHIRKVHTDVVEVAALKVANIDEASLHYPCNNCHQKFLTENVLAHHTKYRHNTSIVKKLTECLLCNILFRRNREFKAHVSNVHRNFPEEMKALKSLETGSTVPLQSKCKYCKTDFFNKHVLKYHHYKTHREEESRTQKECKLCHIIFESNKEFHSHTKNNHKHFPEELMALNSLNAGAKVTLKSKCKFCKKAFFNQHVLRIHFVKIHKEEESKKVYCCEFCKKEFKPDRLRSTQILHHMRDNHRLPKYNFYNEIVTSEGKVNKAEENFKMMMAKMGLEGQAGSQRRRPG
jgi:hypothetical protein